VRIIILDFRLAKIIHLLGRVPWLLVLSYLLAATGVAYSRSSLCDLISLH